uniref:Uncharacterized protein MANES_14G131500 n=1 Tax=Rhizophora mucronata TaxID=61149 RepID=A0A2P2K558_RHIMU
MFSLLLNRLFSQQLLVKFPTTCCSSRG